MFLIAGGLMHIAEDALSKSGIPFHKPYGTPYGAGLYIVNTASEEFTTAGLILAFLALAFVRGFFESGYVADQVSLFLTAAGNALR